MTVLQRLSLASIVLYPTLEILSYALLHWRRDDLAIRKRNKWPICIASLAGWFAYFNLIVSLFGGIPCGVYYVISLLVAPMSVGPQLVRALQLVGKLKHSQLITEDDILAPTRSDQNGRRASKSSSDTSEKLIEANFIMMKTKLMVRFTIAALIFVPTLVLVLAFAISGNAGSLLATDFEQCNSDRAFFFLTPAFGIASTGLALLATILIRKAQDELGLRKEILRNVVFLGVTYIVILIVRLLGYDMWQPLLQTIQQMFLSFSMIVIPCLSIFEFIPPSIIVKQSNEANSTMSISTLPGYAQPIPMHRSGRNSLIGGRISIITTKREQRAREMTVSWDAGLCILLSTQEGINAFSQHCAREFSSENVRFWVAVNEYKSKFDEESCPPSSAADNDDEEDIRDARGSKESLEAEILALAKNIYDSFVLDTAKHQVNLSSRHKSDIKKAIDSMQLVKDTFEAAQKEIFGVMARDSYPRYLGSRR